MTSATAGSVPSGSATTTFGWAASAAARTRSGSRPGARNQDATATRRAPRATSPATAAPTVGDVAAANAGTAQPAATSATAALARGSDDPAAASTTASAAAPPASVI